MHIILPLSLPLPLLCERLWVGLGPDQMCVRARAHVDPRTRILTQDRCSSVAPERAGAGPACLSNSRMGVAGPWHSPNQWSQAVCDSPMIIHESTASISNVEITLTGTNLLRTDPILFRALPFNSKTSTKIRSWKTTNFRHTQKTLFWTYIYIYI